MKHVKRSASRLAGLLLLAVVALLPLLALLPFRAAAQYPFERYPAVQYQSSGPWQLAKPAAAPPRATATTTLQAGTQSYHLRVFNQRIPSDTFYVALSAGGATRQFLEPWYLLPESLVQPVRAADINGDGLTDLKLVINAVGGGGVRGLVRLIYLFGQPGGGFAKVSFLSFHDGPERDFDGDGNCEMVVRELVSYRGHSYWSFNVFRYADGRLVNVSPRYGYPVLIQFLNKPNYQVAGKITPREAQRFLLRQPREMHAVEKL
jgi:hypothetical protein